MKTGERYSLSKNPWWYRRGEKSTSEAPLINNPKAAGLRPSIVRCFGDLA